LDFGHFWGGFRLRIWRLHVRAVPGAPLSSIEIG
jgi:hypothetical protein